MKNLLRASLAAAALVASAGVAQAQTSVTQYSSPAGALGYFFGNGTVYSANTLAQNNNTDTASPTLATSFTLRGNVTKDCSFYGGQNSSARDINLGTLGVVTNSGANVGDAFEMRAPAVANIASGTAGCNFNNTVTIAKANGVAGMTNQESSGFDSNQFQANLPYTINANWVGTTNTTGGQAGGGQSLTVGTNEGSDVWTGGAWRSAFNMLITVDAPNKGLVAGSYQDTITVTLAAS